jgi:PAP2 superfamily protein
MKALMQNLNERRRAAVRPIILGELLVVFLLLRVYDYVKSLESVRMAPALDNGREVLAVERALHIDVEGSANQWLAHHHSTASFLVWWYQYSHITGTMAVLACCYLFFPMFYRRARTALVLTNVVGMTVFVVLPVMPPRLLPNAGFIDSVAAAGYGIDHGGPVEPAQFAAMPSLHLAWATWVGILLFAMLKGVPHRWLVFSYPVLTTIAVVATANHYLLDVFAGVALAVGTLTVCGFLRFVRPPAVEVPVPAVAPVPALELES